MTDEKSRQIEECQRAIVREEENLAATHDPDSAQRLREYVALLRWLQEAAERTQ